MKDRLKTICRVFIKGLAGGGIVSLWWIFTSHYLFVLAKYFHYRMVVFSLSQTAMILLLALLFSWREASWHWALCLPIAFYLLLVAFGRFTDTDFLYGTTIFTDLGDAAIVRETPILKDALIALVFASFGAVLLQMLRKDRTFTVGPFRVRPSRRLVIGKGLVLAAVFALAYYLDARTYAVISSDPLRSWSDWITWAILLWTVVLSVAILCWDTTNRWLGSIFLGAGLYLAVLLAVTLWPGLAVRLFGARVGHSLEGAFLFEMGSVMPFVLFPSIGMLVIRRIWYERER